MEVVLHRNEDTAVLGDTDTIRSVSAGATVAHANSKLKTALESTVVAVGDRLEGRVERIDTVLVSSCRGVVALVRGVLHSLVGEDTTEVRRERIAVDVHAFRVIECVAESGGVGAAVLDLLQLEGSVIGSTVNTDTNGVVATCGVSTGDVNHCTMQTFVVVVNDLLANLNAVLIDSDDGGVCRSVQVVRYGDLAGT